MLWNKFNSFTFNIICNITLSPHDMNRQECRTKRIDSICEVIWIPLCARDGSVIKWGRGEGDTLSIHVVWTQCALGLTRASTRRIALSLSLYSSAHFSNSLPATYSCVGCSLRSSPCCEITKRSSFKMCYLF